MPAVGRPWPSGDNGDSGEIIIPPSPLLSLPWPSTLSSLDLLCRRFTLLLASCGALLFHDRVVDCRALLTVHRVAFLLVDCLALSVLQLGYVKTSTLQSSCLWKKKLFTWRGVQICSCTVVHCGSLVVEHFCSFTCSHFWKHMQSTFEHHMTTINIWVQRPVRWQSRWQCRISSRCLAGTAAHTWCCTSGPGPFDTAAWITRLVRYRFQIKFIFILSRKLIAIVLTYFVPWHDPFH